jgi:hypothetical protein
VNDRPRDWMAKSIWHVVPPKAHEVCPDSKSSAVMVPPNGMSKWVCGSMQPGSTYLPSASITRSASTSSDSPISVIVSSSM